LLTISDVSFVTGVCPSLDSPEFGTFGTCSVQGNKVRLIGVLGEF